MANFVGCATSELGVLPRETEIIKIRIQATDKLQRARNVGAPEACFANPLIVEDAAIDFDRLSDPCVCPPVTHFAQHSNGIEREAVVRRLTHTDEPLRAVSHFLTARAQRDHFLAEWN